MSTPDHQPDDLGPNNFGPNNPNHDAEQPLTPPASHHPDHGAPHSSAPAAVIPGFSHVDAHPADLPGSVAYRTRYLVSYPVYRYAAGETQVYEEVYEEEADGYAAYAQVLSYLALRRVVRRLQAGRDPEWEAAEARQRAHAYWAKEAELGGFIDGAPSLTQELATRMVLAGPVG